jgi:hypothetical protein
MKRARLGVAIALVAGGGLLYAQPRGGGTPDPIEIDLPMERTADLTPREMREKTDELIDEMQGLMQRVIELQQVARKQKDVIKLNCINDKLLQVKQLLNIAEAARTNLVEAIAVQDEEERYHQFSQVTIAAEKVTVLRDEAEVCIGEELVFLGPTEVDMDGPDILDDPTGEDPFDHTMDLEPPGYASPFL